MPKLKEISYFCPAYNEEENLKTHIQKILPVLAAIADNYELLIINNGSTDQTPKIADNLAAQNPRIRVIHHESNRDYGGALKTGFENCNYEWIAYTDSDLQYDFGEIREMLPFLSECDGVIGIRKNRQDSLYRKFQSKIFNLLTKLMFRLKAKDINCSFKVIKKEFIDRIKITSRSSFIDAEILIKTQKKGAKFKEMEVTHYPRIAGAATGHRPQVIFITFKEMFQTLFHKH
ncbi:glycosyltransferase family 2 protein [Candidatus Peregrinibacteria bacterium]|nr:glycosyltransferase family 2 protein [Candidatus Peregrinibacteria bacterium]